MSQYNPTLVPDVIDHVWLNAELAKIETAHDTHATTDIPEKCIPITAVATDCGYSILKLEYNIAGTAYFVFDYTACTLVGDWRIVAGYVAYSATPPTVTITGSPAVNILVAGDVYTAATVTSLVPGDTLTMVITPGDGAGVGRVTACILVKNKHER